MNDPKIFQTENCLCCDGVIEGDDLRAIGRCIDCMAMFASYERIYQGVEAIPGRVIWELVRITQELQRLPEDERARRKAEIETEIREKLAAARRSEMAAVPIVEHKNSAGVETNSTQANSKQDG